MADLSTLKIPFTDEAGSKAPPLTLRREMVGAFLPSAVASPGVGLATSKVTDG